MFRNLSLAVVLVFSIFVSGCASTSKSTLPGDSIDGSYSPTGMKWTNGGYIYMAVKAFEMNGKTAVCGAYLIGDDRVGEEANQEVITNGRILLADTLILRNVGFFQRLPFEGDNMRLQGRPTNCVLTSAAWRPEFAAAEPEFDYPRKRVWTE